MNVIAAGWVGHLQRLKGRRCIESEKAFRRPDKAVLQKEINMNNKV